MLKSLLVERFKLKFHRETRDIPALVLMTAKGGVKLKEAAPDEETRVDLSRYLPASASEFAQL